MSATKLGRSASDSWSMMPHTAQDGLTDTATAAATSPCETHDAPLSEAPTQTHARVTEETVENDATTAASMQEKDDDDSASQASQDSWVELTAAELQSPVSDALPTTEEPAATAVEADADGAIPTPSQVESKEAAEQREEGEEEAAVISAPASDTNETPDLAEDAPSMDGPEVAADIESAATTPEPTVMHAAGPSEALQEERLQPEAPPAVESAVEAAAAPKINLAEFLAGLTLSRAYEATATPPETSLTEREAAAQVFASFAAPEPTDDFTYLAEDDREMEETVDLDFVPSSVAPLRESNKEEASVSGKGSVEECSVTRDAVAAPSPGVTAVLRRRMVAEDWMRTLRGPSPLTPEERVEVFQALFGDTGSAPISAERFREMMVPYQRHCDCLGASYGFHHQGCHLSTESQLTS